jgi:hypothetical protein
MRTSLATTLPPPMYFRLSVGSETMTCIQQNLLWIVSFGLLLVGIPVETSAQRIACDPTVRVSPADPLRYTFRYNRCEGRYSGELSSASPILIAGFGTPGPGANFRNASSVRVVWPVIRADSVALRLSSTWRPVHYQLDTRRPVENRVFEWSALILQRLGLRNRHLVGVASSKMRLPNGNTSVLVPVRISPDGDEPSPPFHLTLLPGRRLKEIYVTFYDNEKTPLGPVRRPLGFGYYPAHIPVEYPLPADLPSGIVTLEIEALFDQGSSTIRAVLWLP